MNRRGQKPAPAVASERLSVRIPEAVEMTGICRTKLYQLIKSGDLKIIKVGATTVISVESLRRFIEANER